MNNNNLDKILRKLGDFDPHANPNWDAFLADNESHLQNPDKNPDQVSGKNTRYSRGIQHTGILFLAIAAIFTTWYLTGDNLNSDSDKTPEKHMATQPREKANAPDETKTGTYIFDEPESISEQPKQASDEVQPQVNDNSIDAVIPISIDEIETEKIIEPEVLQNKTQDSKGVIISDTVFIKKTIFIKDTIRMKKIIR